MKISNAKLEALVLYFVSNTAKRHLGKTKLMKLFYFLDFRHVKKYAAPVTHDTYVKLDYGPIPSIIKNIVDDTANGVKTSLADVISIRKVPGKRIERVTARREFTDKDRKLFSPTEMEILENVCEEFGDKSTKAIKDASHEEAPWKESELHASIPYTLAAHDKDCEMEEKEIEFLSGLV